MMNRTTPWISMMLGVGLLVSGQPASAQLAPGSLDVKWSEGAEHCEAGPPQAPIQVNQYNAQTFILRESLCATFEAPFIYLLLGSSKALLIDTGAVEDPKKMPLADTVMGLLPMVGASKMPLLVLHTHRHLDHRAGDSQFANLPGVQVVPAFLEDVRKHFGFKSWPEGLAQVELGDRTIDVIPTPGHNLRTLRSTTATRAFSFPEIFYCRVACSSMTAMSTWRARSESRISSEVVRSLTFSARTSR